MATSVILWLCSMQSDAFGAMRVMSGKGRSPLPLRPLSSSIPYRNHSRNTPPAQPPTCVADTQA
eukprot:1155688-Pelagomonas_calceolata.AAC.1